MSAGTVAVVAGQRRRSPLGQIVVITRVDHDARLAWGHREADGYKLAKGEGVAIWALEDWPVVEEESIVLRYADTPPSINDSKSGYKGHWAQAYSAKGKGAGRWKAIFDSLLLVQRTRLPKQPAPYVRVAIKLVFDKPARRDPENFRVVLSKALADALVDARVIADDSGTQFQLENIEIQRELGDRRETIVTVSWPRP